MFSCEICEFFQDNYLAEHLRMAASAWIFKSISEKMLLVYISHTVILKERLHT